mmetsp:Transcript_119872/g.382672  ORF Transcript_119872/g.382672 Transcript_119872/m.382672 type:complete len:679 (-) Transcript_119872:289-2325(-)
MASSKSKKHAKVVPDYVTLNKDGKPVWEPGLRAEVTSRRKPQIRRERPETEEAPVSCDLKNTLKLTPSERATWLDKALSAIPKGKAKAQEVFDIVTHRKFASGVPEELGQQMLKQVKESLVFFSDKQQHNIAKSKLVREFKPSDPNRKRSRRTDSDDEASKSSDDELAPSSRRPERGGGREGPCWLRYLDIAMLDLTTSPTLSAMVQNEPGTSFSTPARLPVPQRLALGEIVAAGSEAGCGRPSANHGSLLSSEPRLGLPMCVVAVVAAGGFLKSSAVRRRWRGLARLRHSRSGIARLAATKEQEDTTLSPFKLQQMFQDAQRRNDLVMDCKGYNKKEYQDEAAAIREASNDPNLWDDQRKGTEIMDKFKTFEDFDNKVAFLKTTAEDMKMALEFAKAEVLAEDVETWMLEAKTAHDKWVEAIDKLETEVLLSGKFDALDAEISIFAGAGGDEACDWVEMLERMYIGFGAKQGWTVERVDGTPGDTLGMSLVKLRLEGEFAYGKLRGEHGTHRLVRMWNGKRQTTFSGVEVTPIIPEDQLAQISLDEKDLEFDYFRCGGPGGQNVNKVASGVRAIHKATGVTVRCTQERTQPQNKSIAIRLVKEKLLAIQEQQRASEFGEIRGDRVVAEFGTQVRNYTLAPYTMVKDSRTSHERTDVQNVLSGDLTSLIDAYLRKSSV